MKKRVLISVLDENEGLARVFCQEVARVGLDPVAHFWQDDLAGMAWASVATELRRAECRLWLIAGQNARFAARATRQGLALAAVAAQAAHGQDFPVLLSPAVGSLDVATLPTPLRGAESVKSGLGARAALRAATPRGFRGEYRLDVHGLPGVGLWFEVGPTREPWNGAFLGCGNGDSEGRTDQEYPAKAACSEQKSELCAPSRVVPDAHGVGLAGAIPSTSTLHYPVQGLQIDVGTTRCEAWGLQNVLTPSESYYARLSAVPELLVFGAFPDTDEAEVFTLRLA